MKSARKSGDGKGLHREIIKTLRWLGWTQCVDARKQKLEDGILMGKEESKNEYGQEGSV